MKKVKNFLSRARLVSGFVIFVLGIVGAFPLISQAALRTKNDMPEFLGVTEWINSDPLSRETLNGKVVFVYFWNYTSVNCLRFIHYVKQWDQKYRVEGLVVIGIHTPDFEFEKDAVAVREAVKNLKIEYPVALDHDAALWQRYGPTSRPTRYLIDARGRIRETEEGEGNIEDWEYRIQDFLKERGRSVNVEIEPNLPLVDLSKIRTPTIELGYKRLTQFGNEGAIKADIPRIFSLPELITPDRIFFSGTWKPNAESFQLIQSPAALTIRYKANRVFVVCGIRDPKGVSAEVRLDHDPLPKEKAGRDITFRGEKAYLSLRGYQIYEAVNGKDHYEDHLLEIEFEDSGVEVFSISFG